MDHNIHEQKIVELFDDETGQVGTQSTNNQTVKKETVNDSKKEKTTNEELPEFKLLELLEITGTPKQYKLAEPAYPNLLKRNYFKCPLKLINDNIKLFNKSMKEINFDVRTLKIEPFHVEINTYFNENNKNFLKTQFNDTVSLISPKYEHYINYSKADNIFITCDVNEIPVFLNSIEINMIHKLVKQDGVVVKQTILG